MRRPEKPAIGRQMTDTYLRRQRHILLDMHVPDWDDGFLARFDPEAYVDLCVGTGADAVMVYCNSHAGQSFGPTRSGVVHRAARDRDLVGITTSLLHERGLAVCAYYSAVFNTWAYAENPDWRIVPARAGGAFGPGRRYGVCCPNHPEYLDLMVRQTAELVESYPFDAFFYDMLFWPDVCVCGSCRQRYREEEGADIPESVDWFGSAWCNFQTARERWLASTFRQLRDEVRKVREIPVFHNGGGVCGDLVRGDSPDLAALNDLFGGDFYARGLYSTIAGITPTVMQYMHNISGFCGGKSQLKGVEELKAHALTATAFGGQFMAIDAVEPDGTVNPGAYERLQEVFAAMTPYENYLGGVPVADIGIYSSSMAKVNFADNGRPLTEITLGADRWTPHGAALEGAVRLLSEAHLPIGVFTREALDELEAFAVIILPNVLRMDEEEIVAFRRYVEGGGRLYASGYTSLVTAGGTRHDDFLLADVFGCHLVGEEAASVAYLKPARAPVGDWIAPVRYVTHGEPLALFSGRTSRTTALRVRADADTEVLATVTLPYAGGRGSRDDHDWSSVHGSPPWEDTDRPAVVRRSLGAGEVVYSVADIEGSGAGASTSESAGFGSSPSAARSFFVELIRSLMPGSPTFEADAHPNLWMTAFDDSNAGQLRVCLLNRPASFPSLPLPRVRVRLSPPRGAKFTGLRRISSGSPVEFTIDDEGFLDAEVQHLELFEMLAARYERPTDVREGEPSDPLDAATRSRA